jgi:hypothetical protein
MMKKLFKSKKFLTALLSVLLVLIVGGGLSYAFMFSTTAQYANAFTPAENISAILTEPNWRPANGLQLVPGKTARKDPMITNTCEIAEYVAIRATFQYKNGQPMSGADLRKLLDLLVIDWNSGWVLHSGNMGASPAVQPFVFYYNGILGPGETTPPLFSSVRVKDQSGGLTEAQLRWLQGIKITAGNIVPDTDGLGKFNIALEGAAVQAQGYANAQAAADDLLALFP